MKDSTRNPAASGAPVRRPYQAPDLKEFGTITELTKVLNSPNTNKDNTPANTKT